MTPKGSHDLALAYAGLILTTLFWAGNAVVARAVADQIPAFALSFWRWVIALTLLLPFGLRHLRGKAAVVRANWGWLLLLAALSVGGYNTLLYLAAHSTTAINISLVSATIPVVIAALAWLLLGEAISAAQSLGVAIALGGVLVIVSGGDWRALAALDFRAGDLLMVLAVTIWGLYTGLLRRRPLALHPLGLMTLLVVGGLLVILPFYLWELATGSGGWWRPALLPALAYVGIFPSLLAYLLWNFGVATAGPNRSAIFIYLMPVFTALLAHVFLDEALRGFHALGGALILVGLYLASRLGRSGG